ncbi:MAG: hypothetical protein IKZ90_02675 [Clostridiales bacterium]|nr:hypothetical protein [Clostridiales bacterium]
MTALQFYTVLFGAAAGIGAAIYIAAHILEKKNNYGDSHADPRFYTSSVTFTHRSERMSENSASIEKYIAEHAPGKPVYEVTPRNALPVERVRKNS